MLKMPRGSMVPVIPARETRLEDGGDDVVVSVAPPVPGHLHALDLPTSGIDDEPLTPAAVLSRERGAQNAWRRSRWAIHAQVGDEHLAESLHEHTKPRRSEGCEASQRPAIWA